MKAREATAGEESKVPGKEEGGKREVTREDRQLKLQEKRL